MKVRLLIDTRYPAGWVFNGPAYPAGTVVPVIKAHNIPGEGNLWINTKELKDDCYGILLRPGDYEEI